MSKTLIFLLALLLPSNGFAQWTGASDCCPGGQCETPRAGTRIKQLRRPTSQSHASVPRVIHRLGRQTMACTGVLVHKYDDRNLALILTAAHLFTEGTGDLEVTFPNGDRYAARLEVIDKTWDLALLGIRSPEAAPVAIASTKPVRGDLLSAGGYPLGRAFRTVTGRFSRWVGPGGGQPFDMIDMAAVVQQGDSGGPIFNRRGQLVGIISGCDGRYTTGPCFPRIRAILRRVLRTTGRAVGGSARAALGVPPRSRPVPPRSPVAPSTADSEVAGLIVAVQALRIEINALAAHTHPPQPTPAVDLDALVEAMNERIGGSVVIKVEPIP